MAFINDNPPPATVILISGDRDFAYLLSTVRWRKHNVVLISNSFVTHESLTAQASVAYDWESDVLNTRPPSKPPLFRSHTLFSVAAPTTSQELENLSGSNAHPAVLPNERVVPIIQPSTPYPRPASTTPISTSRPRRATLLPDTSSVDLVALHTAPKAGIPAEAVSASIPPNPTPEDWIEADLAGGYTVVHPSVVHAVVADLYSNRVSPHSR